MRKKLTILLIVVCLSACAKTVTEVSGNSAPVNTAKPEANAAANKPVDAPKTADNKPAAAKTSTDKSACLTAKLDGKRLIPSQTFVFDHEPFPKSCFVTFGSVEDMLDEKDVPRGSTFYIYKDGKQVYEFEDPFDGQPACWVEGVGFEDLSGDGKTEVIIAGSCLAAKDSYPMNAVYENHNDDFRTFRVQNENLDKLKTIKEIADYVKKNKNKFFNTK